MSSFFWSLAWCPWRRIVCSLVSSSEVSENSSGFWRAGGGGKGGERRGVQEGREREEREERQLEEKGGVRKSKV